MIDIGSKLKLLRIENKMTQTELAKALNIGQTTIAAYENGTHTPNLYALISYADYFQCSLDYLVGRENEMGKIVINNDVELTPNELHLLEKNKKLTPKLRKLLEQNAEVLLRSELNSK